MQHRVPWFQVSLCPGLVRTLVAWSTSSTSTIFLYVQGQFADAGGRERPVSSVAIGMSCGCINPKPHMTQECKVTIERCPQAVIRACVAELGDADGQPSSAGCLQQVFPSSWFSEMLVLTLSRCC